VAISIFDIFKIGIGPSSSHTVGPMRAARLFVQRLQGEGLLGRTSRVRCELYGSLGATGKGHGSDKAVLLGLLGHEPDTVDVVAIPVMLKALRESENLVLPDGPAIRFDEKTDLVFNLIDAKRFHSTLTVCASPPLMMRAWNCSGGHSTQ